MRIKKAYILAGGEGKRLKEETTSLPKPMVDVGGLPFIQFLINDLVSCGFEKIVILAGHHGSLLFKRFNNKRVSSSHIEVIVEKFAMGTGGAIVEEAYKNNDEFFLVLNGDSWLEDGVRSFVKKLKTVSLSLTESVLMVHNSNDRSRFGAVKINNGLVVNVLEKEEGDVGLINSGIYLLSRKQLLKYPLGQLMSLEQQFLPRASQELRLKYFQAKKSDRFIDIGVPDSLSLARKSFTKWYRKKAIFWDRDNTLIKDSGYTYKITDLDWKTGALDSLAHFSKKGFRNFLVTNQSGIARGHFTEGQMHKFHRRMIDDVINAGGFIDFIAFCPHHPDFSSTGEEHLCDCRKPKTGMLKSLCRVFPVDIENSWLVGDKKIDIQAADKFGLRSRKLSRNEDVRILIKEFNEC